MFEVIVTDNRWMWSIESACIMVKSVATGKTLCFDKWHKKDNERSPADWTLLQKLSWCQSGQKTQLTVDEGRQLIAMYNRENSQPAKVMHQPVDENRCSCGGKMHVKNHGGWTGYHCTKCGQGGSWQNKTNREAFNRKRKKYR